MHKILVAQVNINTIRNKFDPLMTAVAWNIDILLITETKTDSTFPVNYLILMTIIYPTDMTVIVTVLALVYVRDNIRSRII